MKYLDFSASTSGEKLFQYLISEIIDKKGMEQLSGLPMLRFGMRSDEMGEYLFGIFTMNLLARISKKTARIIKEIDNESLFHGEIIRYFQESLGIPREPQSNALDKLASLAYLAHQDSGQKINNTTKKEVNGGNVTCKCYICDATVFIKTGNDDVKIQYEHLWPSSYGGNSIKGNLLPSCKWCNNAKDDMLLWQNSHLHSFVLKPNPSNDEWTRIQRRERVAKHRKFIFDMACHKKITLVEAAIEVGPADIKNMRADDEDDSIDFFNFSFIKV
ncbi:HNH endonuclease [Janthinobacterium sp. FW305-128]|uniref:HNH endonuclease n=1 Tax=Janthinobacterium sp. FW305-128 TaxID=2775055 RepID=UPI001E35EC94|nr:HNH endonuclease [Janthinobacterium sp. FW305-128]MCC7684055.1 hypothetical protein [Janthinobacterium sp. FW305-128]